MDFSQLANGFRLSVKLRMVLVLSKEACQFPGLLVVNQLLSRKGDARPNLFSCPAQFWDQTWGNQARQNEPTQEAVKGRSREQQTNSAGWYRGKEKPGWVK